MSDTSRRRADGGATADDADDDLEVSRLDAGRSRGAGGDDGAVPGETAPISPPATRVAPRRRVMAILTVGGAVLLVLVVALATNPPGGAAVGSLVGRMLGLPSPTPTATLAVGADAVGLTNSVPWGTLTVDGHTVDLHTLSETHNGAAFLRQLSRGSHMLVYTAAPFPTLRCQFSVPAAGGDTCPRSFAAVPWRAVDLQATPDHLPAAQYDALQQAVDSALAHLVIPDGQVEPGDHYQSRSGAIVGASEPLLAHVQVALATPLPGTVSGNEFCTPLCVVPPVDERSAQAWELVASPTATVQMTDAHGAIVETVLLDVSLPILSIEAGWTGVWSVRPARFAVSEVASLVCDSGIAQMRQLVPSFRSVFQANNTAPEPAGGCVVRFTVDSSSSSTATDTFVLFARYGALMAADAATQRALPQVPRPSSHERILIAQLTP